jgi:serine/threonine protein kinase
MAATTSIPRIPPASIVYTRDALGDRIELGHGSFGRVYAAMYAHEPVAVKVINGGAGGGGLSAADVDYFWREAEVHYRVRHAHVVVMLGACVDDRVAGQPPKYALVMERMQGGDLGAAIHTAPTPPPLSQRCMWILQVRVQCAGVAA